MYLNLNNFCSFEGRVIKEPEITEIKSTKGIIKKARITLAVDRPLTKQQKEKAKAEGQPTADFIDLEAVGIKAEFISNWIKKGSAVKTVASYRTFNYTDKAGNKKYGSIFDIVDIGFTTTSIESKPKNNFEDFNDFQTIDDEEVPF